MNFVFIRSKKSILSKTEYNDSLILVHFQKINNENRFKAYKKSKYNILRKKRLILRITLFLGVPHKFNTNKYNLKQTILNFMMFELLFMQNPLIYY